MASVHTDSRALGQPSAQLPNHRPRRMSLRHGVAAAHMSSDQRLDLDDRSERSSTTDEGQQHLLEDNCEKSHDDVGAMITMDSTTKSAGLSVAPFLARHIPEQYAPLGVPQPSASSAKDPNTRYCYRHRPDSKCRRTADEPTMDLLQRVGWSEHSLGMYG